MVTKTDIVMYPYMLKNSTTGGSADQVIDNIHRMDSFATGFDTTISNSNTLYRRQIAKKANASTAYTRNITEYNIPVVRCNSLVRSTNPSIKDTRGFHVMRWSGVVPSSFVTTDTACDDRALNKLKRKLSSHTKDFNLIVPLAQIHELRQTVVGAANLTTGLLETLLSIRKTKGKSAFKYASEAWLTYGFGIAPLVSDTKEICESIQAYLLREDHTSVLTGTDSISWSSGRSTLSSVAGAIGTKFEDHATIHHELSYQYKGGFNFTLRSANDYGVLDHFHVNLPALIPSAWELVPFSWVADYFATVGPFLDDVFTGSPVNAIYLNRTRKYKATGSNFISYKQVNGGIILSQTPGSSQWSYRLFNRTPLASLPRSSLRLRTMDEVGRYSLNKLANLASILGMGHTNVLPRKPWR